jgi:hypothetical protein
MDNTMETFAPPAGFKLAPLHSFNETAPLRVCLMVRTAADAVSSPFLLLREMPDARVYLGAICDAADRVLECVEIWVQTVEYRDITSSSQDERLANFAFDQRWREEAELWQKHRPEAVIATGMERRNPSPVLIKVDGNTGSSIMAGATAAPWQLCTEDETLESFGLEKYSTSSSRYLHQPKAEGTKTFLATTADSPVNSHAQGIERLRNGEGGCVIFNAHAGLIRVTRFEPLDLDGYAEILEGRAWSGPGQGLAPLFQRSIYGELQAWSGSQKGIPFLLYGGAKGPDRLNEIFFLKLALLRDMFKEVRAYAQTLQLPLLNLTPASFHVRVQRAGDQFPLLWATKCELTRPGQAYPLKIKSTEQKYFVRLGKVEPSPFLPEGLGAHSFGIGRVQMVSVRQETDGVVLQGTLVADEALGLAAHDLLWFKLPLAEEKMTFYAHVYAGGRTGLREARFRTVPARLNDSLFAALKRTEGTTFQRAPFEIWPLLSSPCDLHSLGIMAIRILLANSQTDLPSVVDEILRLSRQLGDEFKKEPGPAASAAKSATQNPAAGKEPASHSDQNAAATLKGLLERDQKLLDLVSPHSLIETGWTPKQARSQMRMELWTETVSFILRLFPGAGPHSYCKSFGDVSPLALETVFDAPLQDLEKLVWRLRSLLTPSLCANEELASLILGELAKS